MQSLIRIVAFEFAGGDAFFLGLALLVTGALVAAWHDGPRIRVVFRLATVCSWIVIAASGTPLPLWFYGMGVLLSIVALRLRFGRSTTLNRWVALAACPPVGFSRWSEDTGGQAGQAASATPSPLTGQTGVCGSQRRFRIVVTLLVCWCAAGGAWEFSYRLPPRLDESARYDTLVVIGDSVSAGLLGPKERTWPKQFRERYFGSVVDLSREGATAQSALRQAQTLNGHSDNPEPVVLIEIGGNDYFELVPPTLFEANLDSLLTALRRPNRQLIMLELPLPPFYNAYGRVQRELAARHHVPLISKREFARVVFTSGATLDTVHLSETGHNLFADMVWEHVGGLLREPSFGQMTLYSLAPERLEGANFHGYPILGKVETTSPSDQLDILAAVQKGIDEGNLGAMGCFEPHHGLRLKRNGKTIDYVICFHCLAIEVYVDGKESHLQTSPHAHALLDSNLEKGGVTPPKD
jgi:lysophospholipase L1-like esterase